MLWSRCAEGRPPRGGMRGGSLLGRDCSKSGVGDELSKRSLKKISRPLGIDDIIEKNGG